MIDSRTGSVPGPRVWADVEDLFHYASVNPRPSGIQRVAFAIQRNLQAALAGTTRLRFVRHAGNPPRLQEVCWADVENVFSGLSLGLDEAAPARNPADPPPAALPKSWPLEIRHHLGRAAFRMSPRLRDPLLRAWLLQKHAAEEFKAALQARRMQPAPAPLLPPESGPPIRAGDVFLVLGAPWVHADFGALLRSLREDHGMRIALLLYDLIPALRPEWCTRELVENFRAWLAETLPLSDVVLAISRHTAEEAEGWAASAGIRLAAPVRPIPIGTELAREAKSGSPHPPGLPRPGSYILYVSTLEARKNHALLLRVWRDLLDEEQRDQRPSGAVPDLVFAGRVGWLVSDLLQQLESASWFDGRVRLVRDPTDTELRALYEGCLFSLFPSWHEGWGLPVTEALALGIPVLCSSASGLPEAGQTLARYCDPGDTSGWHRAVAALLDDPGELAAWRSQIRSRFQPTSWSATGRAILDALCERPMDVPAEPPR